MKAEYCRTGRNRRRRRSLLEPENASFRAKFMRWRAMKARANICVMVGKSVIVQDVDLTGPRPSWLSRASKPARRVIEEATNAGCLVIDLSGLFALEPDVPLVVPDVNQAPGARRLPQP